MNDLISVIVPIYNVRPYLRRCINSILVQTYQNLEIILIDDGSDDGCAEICDEYGQADHRIIIRHKKNGGLSDARNMGIDIANGKYITFIDSDDYITNDFIEYAYDLIDKYNAEISIARLYKTSKENETFHSVESNTECFEKKDALRELLYADKYSVAVPAKLYLASLFNNVRFPVGKFSEDMYTTYKVFDKAEKVVYGDKICYYYYCRSGSLITSSFSLKKLDVVEGLEQLQHDLPLEEYGMTSAYASQMIECVMTILQSKPSIQQINNLRLWEKIRKYRAITLCDRYATLRVRGYAALSYLGLHPTIGLMNFYYRWKWKRR